MSNFCSLPESPEAFDCVLLYDLFPGEGQPHNLSSCKSRIFPEASHVSLIVVSESKNLFTLMKMYSIYLA